MSNLRAKAQYAFVGDSSAGELSFREGELLAIIRQDVGDGWWEVSTSAGKRGLAPASYLQVISSQIPPPPTSRPRPPPPIPAGVLPSRILPPALNGSAHGNGNGNGNAATSSVSLQSSDDSYMNTGAVGRTSGNTAAPPTTVARQPFSVAALNNTLAALNLNSTNSPLLSHRANAPCSSSTAETSVARERPVVNQNMAAVAAQLANENDDSFDDDSFDEDDSDYERPGASDSQRRNDGDAGGLLVRQQSMSSMSTVSGMVEMAKSGALRRGLCRAFVKLGGEAFLLGQYSNLKPLDSERLQLIESSKGVIVWRPPTQCVTITISTPRKATKLRGLKTFTAYQLSASSSGLQVSRRYKQFDWLMNRLRDKFVFVCVPPLPDKQITGLYEEEFIKSRMRKLQLWVNRVTRHPLLSQSELLQHFVSCTDEKRWKQGKRKAEKNEFQGGRLFNAVDLSGVLSATATSAGVTVVSGKPSFDVAIAESEMDSFDEQLHTLDAACKQLSNVLHTSAKQQSTVASRVAKPLSDALSQLARAGFEPSNRAVPGTDKVHSALLKSSSTYSEIAKLFSDQAAKDVEPFMDSLSEYHGLLSQLPEVTLLHRNTIAAVHECAYQYNDEQKLSEEEFTKICQRAQVMTTAVEAEANFFNYEKVRDFREMIRSYLQQQVSFHREVAGKLEGALKEFT